MALAHYTQNGFLVRSEEADSMIGEGTFTPLPEYDPKTQIPRYMGGSNWAVVPLSERDNYVPPVALPTMEEIMSERDRRINAGFPFADKMIQSRPDDRENIAGANNAAERAIALGAQPGELNWQKKLDPQRGAEVFAWITMDNSFLPLDAEGVRSMAFAAMFHKQHLVFRAKELKESGATDILSDEAWA